MSPTVWDAMMGLRAYLRQRVLLREGQKPKSQGRTRRAHDVPLLLEHPDELPRSSVGLRPTACVQPVVDYVAG